MNILAIAKQSALRGVALAILASATQAQTVVVNVPVGDSNALTQAVRQSASTPGVQTRITLGQGDFMFAGGNASMVVPGWVTISGSGNRGTRLRAAPNSEGHNSLFVVPAGGRLQLDNLQIDGFRNGSAGAALLIQGGTASISNSTLSNNRAASVGGAIYIDSGMLTLSGSTLEGNRAGFGGAIGVQDHAPAPAPRVHVQYNQFRNNSAEFVGCDANINPPASGAPVATFIGNQFSGTGCDNVRVENPAGGVLWFFNTATAGTIAQVLHSTSSYHVLNGSYWLYSNQVPSAAKSLCSDSGSHAIQSLGANIATDGSCFLNGPNDLVTQSPGVGSADASGAIPTAADSPAIERGAATMLDITIAGAQVRSLPCGYRDLRGLGRPQDADLDGVFSCDTGAYETQGGPNLGNALSASYYDTSRSGEGSFIESIGGGKAVVATFTYAPDGGLAWMTGVGNIVGNSVVVDELVSTSGGTFGASFNPASVVRTPVGGASFVFPSCEAGAQPGQWTFQGRPGSGYDDVIARASRLSSPVPCSGSPGPNAGKSGSFYSATRSGEGAFVQFLPNGSAVVIWYTYDLQGRQFWAFASSVTVDGNTVTASMVYPAQSTRFGRHFNASELRFAPWGTLTMTYSGCNAMSFAYDSTVAGFGSGQYNYTRLTTLQGTSCP